MKIGFIFPTSPFNSKEIDDDFKEQYELLNQFPRLAVDIDEMTKLINLDKKELNSETLWIYRGWMLQKGQYQKLNHLVEKMNGRLLTSPEQYLNAHHLPNWIDSLQEYSMPTKFISLDDMQENSVQKINSILNGMKGDRVMVKDYVKSLKTGSGNIIQKGDDISQKINEMIHFKGSLEGGLVFRQYIDLAPHSEHRFFVFNQQLHSSLSDLSIDPLNLPLTGILAMAYQIKEKINLPFYSIDIALTKNLKPVLIEIGDGQVSDYVGWDIHNFIQIFQTKTLQNKKGI